MRWLPAHKAHAIERVNLTFQFAEALPIKPWQALLNAATLELPGEGFNSNVDAHEMPFAPFMQGPIGGLPGGGVNIQIGGPIPFGQGAPAAISGRNFQAVDDNQVREEVQLHRNRFTHSSAIYDGWQSHSARVLSLLKEYLDKALELSNIQVVKLEYWDRFVFDGVPDEAPYAELLKAGSPYLPHFPLETQKLWHSHSGFFLAAPAGVRRLVNINLDAIDLLEMVQVEAPGGNVPTRRSVGVYTMAQDTLDADVSPAAADGMLSTLEDLHTILKDTFAAVITREAADRISLNARASS